MSVKDLAARRAPAAEFQEPGTVSAVEGRDVSVRLARRTVRARVARSCLLAPEPGDTVLVASAGSAGVYVLAVLEREAGTASRLVLEGDATVVAPRGTLGFVARDGVEVTTAGEVAVAASRVGVRAREGELFVERILAAGASLRAEFTRVAAVGEAVEGVFERLTARVKRAYRYVAETDQLRAERIDHAAREDVSLHGGAVLVSADALVKVDSEQVHLG